jgi:probable HAF family extracellular repeat protein
VFRGREDRYDPIKIDVSGASAYPQAINPAGAVVGFFYDQNGAGRGFLWTP